MKQNDAQLIVKIIAILGMIGSIIGAIMGLLVMFVSPIAAGIVSRMESSRSVFVGFVGGALISIGIITILFSIFAFIVCMNLFRFREWARVAAIVFAGFGILISLMALQFGIIGLVVHGGVLYLLAFNKDIKKLFK